jgi:hypothetical protein
MANNPIALDDVEIEEIPTVQQHNQRLTSEEFTRDLKEIYKPISQGSLECLRTVFNPNLLRRPSLVLAHRRTAAARHTRRVS